jgi:CRISPR-associated endonuclease/helicase Cas3
VQIMTVEQQFEAWFKRAIGHEPYPFQVRFACHQPSPSGKGEGEGSVSGEGLLVDVPTGLGKTAMAVLGWLWRRRFHPDKTIRKATPRRLVYCLPMRVLVEQTRDNAVLWLHKHDLLAGTAEFDEGKDGGKKLRLYTPDLPDSSAANKIPVHVLMGGEEQEDWDIYPEQDQIIVGTQDMLLSRALNRGYAATRSRWPIQFGLLNTDCLWVFDEIQLMGAGLATTAQLEAFRRLLPDKGTELANNGHGCQSVWMSATMQRDWLKTVDFASFVDGVRQLTFDFEQEINSTGQNHEACQALERLWQAKKPVRKAKAVIGDTAGLAQEVREAHKPSTRTIVIVNTVKRGRELFKALMTRTEHPNSSEPSIVLLHSRFRPEDRKKQVDRALTEIKTGEPDTIVVSTQVIEAGVDVSATTLFTELAPWASLVQRFGRCNRRGEDNDNAAVRWIPMPAKDADAEKPYELKDLQAAAEQLTKLSDMGLKSLHDNSLPLPFEHNHVIRRKDLIDLFDTTPDLAGNDIDIDRFVRDVEDSDVRVFWRDFSGSPNETEEKEAEPAPRREELCPAPIGEFKKFVADNKRKRLVWRWSFLDTKWEGADERTIAPGQVFLVHASAGGYSAERGWDPDSRAPVNPIPPPGGIKGDTPDANEREPLSRIGVWQTIAEHTDDLFREVDRILDSLPMKSKEAESLRHATRWHDRGKAHHVFQNAIDDGQVVERKGQTIQRRDRPEDRRGCRFIAKAPDKQKNGNGRIVAPGFWRRYDWLPKEGRKHFRHELASALSVLDPRHDKIPSDLRDLVAYLVAAHHGKVRLSIRSLPDERRPDGNRRFARGVWDDDDLSATDLGGGVTAPAITLSLEPMELGLCEEEPFRGQPSWAERMLGLRGTLGPFRLAYLEAILRAADMRVSREAERREAAKQRGQESPRGKEAAS